MWRCLSVCICVLIRVCICVYLHVCLCDLSSDSSSSGNPSRLPGQPAPTSWCMRSRWSGVAATTAQPYLITNKRVVPSVRYQAFSAKQTVIPASQTLALLLLLLRGESNIEIEAQTTPPTSPLYPPHSHTNMHTCILIFLPKHIHTDQHLKFWLLWIKKMSMPERRLFIVPL